MTVQAPELFHYSAEQWQDIKRVIVDALGVPTGRQWLRERIEIAVSMHRHRSGIRRQTPRRAELVALRDDVERLRARIIAALDASTSGLSVLAGDSNDFDMICETGEMCRETGTFFDKLDRNLARQIAGTAGRQANACKAERDKCWEELLAIWCELGGKPYGADAATFIRTASIPVLGANVPPFIAVIRWLERRRDKIAKPVKKPASLRRVA